MLLMGTRSEPNTIALGAVATGNMNAQLALMAAGIMIFNGSMPIASEADIKTGISIAVVAVLLVSSVKNVMTKQMVRIKTNKCTSCKNIN